MSTLLASDGVVLIRDNPLDVFFRQLLMEVKPAFRAVTEGHEDQTVDAGAHMMTYTVPFNIKGLPALSMRFGRSLDGMPIAVQLAAPWHAESTVLHLASLLESVSTVRDLHPNI
ncbi:MAG: aspartyl-tRNA(Asn)/glutamyl-tRNA(Gln) amidotransferase subunit [Arthrobacter pascens]|jgi:aspartyl-tRNA(Asn)/glutamyl-tRNA(Gln) amidotransferase subunit A|nr:aspartyl-tRNA(Asn)/glutamyl-tRNA(Gln) amidotransferase subunit [Arthrobacter pascens]